MKMCSFHIRKWKTITHNHNVSTMMVTFLLILLTTSGVATVPTMSRTFRSLSDVAAGTTHLESAWTTSSIVACAVECLDRYPSTCESFIYHETLHLCTPGSSISFDLPSPDPSTEGSLYGRNFQCDTSDGFSLVTSSQGLRACLLYVPDLINIGGSIIIANHAYHEANCRALGGDLVVTKTAEKFALVNDFIGEMSIFLTFFGLYRVTTGETSFVWADGDPFGEFVDFALGEPSTDYEMCGCLMNGKMYDCPCDNIYSAVCERNLF